MAGRVVLLVEADDTLRETLEGALDFFGFVVFAAPSVEEALCLAHETMPRVILLDLWTAGPAAIRRFRSLGPTRNVPLILLTDLPVGPRSTEAPEATADAVIVKPFDLDELEALLECCLAEGPVPDAAVAV